MFDNLRARINEAKEIAAIREEHWTKSALRPLARKIMYTEVPIARGFPIYAGAKEFYIGKVKRFPGSEAEHSMAIGAPGTGKTIAINDHLDQIRAHGQPAIIFDPTGEFVEKFYREGRDIILSPFDERAVAWNLFGELQYAFDVTNIAEALVEVPKMGEKFWANNARILFSDLVRVLDRQGKRTNKDLYYWAAEAPLAPEIDVDGNPIPDSPPTALSTLLEGTHGGELMNPKSEKTAIGIRSQLSSTMLCWPFLKDSDNPFSLRQFIRDCDDPKSATYDRWVFLSSRGDAHALMKPLISLWLEIVCSGILSLSPNMDRRIHLVIDELPSLQQLPSLETLMAQGRKFGVAAYLAIQLFPQLAHTYGREKAEAMFGVSGTIICFRAGEPTSAKFMSEALGNMEMAEKQANRSVSLDESRDTISTQTQKQTRDAILSGEILSLEKGQGIIRMPNMPLIKFRIFPKNRESIAPGYMLRKDLSWKSLQEAAEKQAQAQASWRNTSPDDPEKVAATAAAHPRNPYLAKWQRPQPQQEQEASGGTEMDF